MRESWKVYNINYWNCTLWLSRRQHNTVVRLLLERTRNYGDDGMWHEYEKVPWITFSLRMDGISCWPWEDGTIQTVLKIAKELVKWKNECVGTQRLLLHSSFRITYKLVTTKKSSTTIVMAHIQHSEFIACQPCLTLRNCSVRLFWLLDWSGVKFPGQVRVQSQLFMLLPYTFLWCILKCVSNIRIKSWRQLQIFLFCPQNTVHDGKHSTFLLMERS